ncbi:hypothetical protein [Aequorivita echinoideorum]|uniref:Uncharacterized protein n=1 Tax=Aequorivita echinoideorum TaxID=1549647 RepID=A0ABS5S3R1_9FLAO|nr:hypothetical protein [Aequorivita echinoideorum]MBT0607608.1 hypothetical protein [Aequorivita echinoideorum]
MANLEKILKKSIILDRISIVLTIIGMGIALLLLAYSAIGLYNPQKNSPERELQANAQTTNA